MTTIIILDKLVEELEGIVESWYDDAALMKQEEKHNKEGKITGDLLSAAEVYEECAGELKELLKRLKKFASPI